MRRNQNLARTTFCVHQDQLARLRAMSESTGTPVAWMVRRAIQEFFSRNSAMAMPAPLSAPESRR